MSAAYTLFGRVDGDSADLEHVELSAVRVGQVIRWNGLDRLVLRVRDREIDVPGMHREATIRVPPGGRVQRVHPRGS